MQIYSLALDGKGELLLRTTEIFHFFRVDSDELSLFNEHGHVHLRTALQDHRLSRSLCRVSFDIGWGLFDLTFHYLWELHINHLFIP